MGSNTFEEIWDKLKSCKKVLLKLHDRPDGDSLGSCAAMKYVLEKEGVEVKLISKDDISENLKAFEFSKEVEFEKNIGDVNLKDFDAVVFLDHSDLSYSNDNENIKKLLKEIFVINIDHHPTNTYFGNLNYIDSSQSSACSILLDFFRDKGIEFDKELSLRLIVGICTDSGFFLYGDSVKNMEDAIFLLKQRIDYEKEVYDVIRNESWELKKLHGILLTNMKKETIDGKVVGYSFATKEDYLERGISESNIRAGVSTLQTIGELDVIFTLTETRNGSIKGSFRSKKFDTTLYSIALGGGGHKKASAFLLEKISMKDAIEKVLKTIKEKGFVPAE